LPNGFSRSRGTISFNGVWKKFRTGEAHDSLRDLLPALFKRPAVGASDDAPLRPREFWAVRDVSFRVDPGEVLGIIGANGAGKSTVLKLLTKVLRPTRGTISAPGRIGALIEVAAGFHPDLTGRENVFLQGTIMGMRVREVARKFDDIVEFAGISDFIDTPVKRYSSGMNARLGFSIAAHIEPDALVIDEVLAVGDLAFQTRAFARVAEMAERGIPVIVVSHQLDRVASLSTRAMVLDHGAIAKEGPADECISFYTTQATKTTEEIPLHSPIRLTALDVPAQSVKSGERASFRVTGEIDPGVDLEHTEPLGLRVRSTSSGELVSIFGNKRCGLTIREPGRFVVEVDLQFNLPPGVYMLEVHPHDGRRQRPMHQSLVASMTVTEGTTFIGKNQLNPRMRFAEPRTDR